MIRKSRFSTCTPEKGEYWDSPYSTLIHLYGYAKAALTGSSPTEVSDQKKINLR